MVATLFIVQDGNKTDFYKSKNKTIRKDNTTYIYDQKHAYKYGDNRVCFFNKNESKAKSFTTNKQHTKNLNTIRAKIKELFRTRIDVN